jgi:predicted flap endonuclease-1-like 5' DNA nuclease
MKKQYWFVGLFGVWCLLSALWYILSVKGLNTESSSFSPQESLVAILEILVMMLVACLLGYGIAWWLREEVLERREQKIQRLTTERVILAESHDDLKNQLELWREKHKRELASAQLRVNDLAAEKSKLLRELDEMQKSLQSAIEEGTLKKSYDPQLESELNTARYRIKQLEFQTKESEEVIARLKNELASAGTKKVNGTHSEVPFARHTEPTRKDDLTEIKGIGPFIEKRLNMIGIYSFQQLAELTPEMVDRVGAAIEFFPHRIIKDDWVGQATILMATKSY